MSAPPVIKFHLNTLLIILSLIILLLFSKLAEYLPSQQTTLQPQTQGIGLKHRKQCTAAAGDQSWMLLDVTQHIDCVIEHADGFMPSLQLIGHNPTLDLRFFN
jgi:hypothetical protein